MWEEYHFPGSVSEALEILSSCRGEARVIAGGTNLVIDLKDQARDVKYLVDISGIEEFNSIEQNDHDVRIGAAVTHRHVASSKLIQEKAQVLAEAALAVGSPQIRNQGTVAGNVIDAKPAADTAVALFTLDAQVEITSSNGARVVPIETLYRGIGVSAVDSTAEIVTALRFRSLRSNQGSAFLRLAQRKALALPMLNVAVVVTLQNEHFEEGKIVVAPVAPVPLRIGKAEAVLNGASIGLNAIDAAAELAAEEAQPRDSELRGSAEYRKSMVKVLVRRALEMAVQRAKQGDSY
jgi:carbon-monoxide dehydrogenase medium subunit